jgi:hypothetical protein
MREKANPVSEPSFPGGMVQASAAGGEVPILPDGCQKGPGFEEQIFGADEQAPVSTGR